jgi:peptidylprolyl isomerase
MNRTILSILCLISPFAFAEEPATPPVASTVESSAPVQPVQTPDVAKISQALGQLMGKNLESMGIKFDIAKVIEGLKDASQGRDALMTEAECIEAITSAQEAHFKEMASENLKKAEEFLTKNKTASGVKDLEPGKVQYRIEKDGSGPLVEEKSAPLIRYTGKFLDGTVFGSSKEEDRIDLAEEDLLPGFRKALVGMKEGEKRTVYIHPELGYGAKDYHLPPNSLLTFEIEVLKANAPAEKSLDSLSTTHPHSKGNPEIAQPFEDTKAVR